MFYSCWPRQRVLLALLSTLRRLKPKHEARAQLERINGHVSPRPTRITRARWYVITRESTISHLYVNSAIIGPNFGNLNKLPRFSMISRERRVGKPILFVCICVYSSLLFLFSRSPILTNCIYLLEILGFIIIWQYKWYNIYGCSNIVFVIFI